MHLSKRHFRSWQITATTSTQTPPKIVFDLRNNLLDNSYPNESLLRGNGEAFLSSSSRSGVKKNSKYSWKRLKRQIKRLEWKCGDRQTGKYIFEVRISLYSWKIKKRNNWKGKAFSSCLGWWKCQLLELIKRKCSTNYFKLFRPWAGQL